MRDNKPTQDKPIKNVLLTKSLNMASHALFPQHKNKNDNDTYFKDEKDIYFKKAEKGKQTYVIFPKKCDSSSEIFENILKNEYIAENGYGVIVRGCNYEETQYEENIYNSADAITNFLTEAKIEKEKVIIIGSKDGATEASHMASNVASASEKYASVTLIDPSIAENEDNIRTIPEGTQINIVSCKKNSENHNKCYKEAKKRDSGAVSIESKSEGLWCSKSSFANTLKLTKSLEFLRHGTISKEYLMNKFHGIKAIKNEPIVGTYLRDLYLKEYVTKERGTDGSSVARGTIFYRNAGSTTNKQIDQRRAEYEAEPEDFNAIKFYDPYNKLINVLVQEQRESVIDQIHTLLAKLAQIISDPNNEVELRTTKAKIGSANKLDHQKHPKPSNNLNYPNNYRKLSKNNSNFQRPKITERKIENIDFHNLFKNINKDVESTYNTNIYNNFINQNFKISYTPKTDTQRSTGSAMKVFAPAFNITKSIAPTSKEKAEKYKNTKAQIETIIKDVQTLTNSLAQYKELMDKNDQIILDEIALGIEFDNPTKFQDTISKIEREVERTKNDLAAIGKSHKAASEHADALFFEENDTIANHALSFAKLIKEEKPNTKGSEKKAPADISLKSKNDLIKGSKIKKQNSFTDMVTSKIKRSKSLE